MKKYSLISLVSSAVIASAFLACEPMGPASYTVQIGRIATVNVGDGKASLNLDLTTDKLNLDNFNYPADADHFNVSNGERVIAIATLYYEDGVLLREQHLDKIALKYPIQDMAAKQPSDTLNFDYDFSQITLGDMKYPKMWRKDSLLNISPAFYTMSSETPEFLLYPTGVSEDTLRMRLYSDIPECRQESANQTAGQLLLCFDLNSLRDQLPDAQEDQRRKQMMHALDSLNPDKVVLQVMMPDTLRGYQKLNGELLKYKRNLLNGNVMSEFLSVDFDF